MGTHGLKGLQFVTGGRALEVVRQCSVPVIITQTRPIRETGYDDIVVPLDLHQDTKQKLAIVAEMASYFHGRVHIISPANLTSSWKPTSPQHRICVRLLRKRKIAYTTTISENSSGGFVKDVIRYAPPLKPTSSAS